MRVHFIAIGGSVMHNLAIELKKNGFNVSGSDDDIFDPAYSVLKSTGILPEQMGWFPEKITSELDAVILGMHARTDNPELLKAQELGLKIYSYPEYIYQQSVNKQRIVIAGSHGKTTITAMIMHVLKFHNRHFDYVIGAKVRGFDSTVRLSTNAPIIVIEGDEYPASPIDKVTPKFIHYHHHIGLISGISWDHVNVYPSFDSYVKQFESFVDNSPKSGVLTYCDDDVIATMVAKYDKQLGDVTILPYSTHKNKVRDGKTYLVTPERKEVEIRVFGEHNMKNISGAMTVCSKIGITDDMFYKAISTFEGASMRLEMVAEKNGRRVYRDFAHAPSKVEATIEAVKSQYPDKQLVAVLEFHTFSSLNKTFIPQYSKKLNRADISVIYYNPKILQMKNLETIGEYELKVALRNPSLRLFTEIEELKTFLLSQEWHNKNLLLMSSGNFDNLDIKSLAEKVLS